MAESTASCDQPFFGILRIREAEFVQDPVGSLRIPLAYGFTVCVVDESGKTSMLVRQGNVLRDVQ
jgi:hypothetical protein